MSDSLLRTKLFVPPLRPNLVPRPHLIKRLNQGLQLGYKLTLISAPAGFGKTTLVRSWLDHCERPIAWLSLDPNDNDPYRFWAYIIVALRAIQEDFGQAILATFRSSQLPPVELILRNIINEIVEISDQFVLVLDDFHLITSPGINDDVALLLNFQPPQMHLVLSTRVDPPWPLARLRAGGEMTELRRADLRFTHPEAMAFLRHTMDLNLSSDDVAALETRIEGWVAGLQMAALSMQGSEDVTEFISSFTGSNQFILDYLMEEVFGQQPVDIQAFLLKTSILERLTAPLCDAIVRDDSQVSSALGSQEILTRLEQANLFLVPLDNDRLWYRYHHLFADLLRSRLRQARADEVPLLHLRASTWYEHNGLIADAVSHAFAAGDVEQAARLIEGNAFAMMDHGQLSTLVAWLDALPRETVQSRPWLCVAHAWALIYSGQLNALDALLIDVEVSLSKTPVSQVGNNEHVAGHLISIRAYNAALKGDMSRAAELAREAMERLPDRDLAARSWTASLLANALQWTGDLAAADQVFAEASAIIQSAGEGHVAVDVLCDWAGLQIMQGRLREAAATCQDALVLADDYASRTGRRLPVKGHAHSRLSAVFRQRNDLEAALHHARESVRLCEEWGWAEILVGSYISLAETLHAFGDTDIALSTVQKARQAAQDISPWFETYLAALEARYKLAQGDKVAAYRWASIGDQVTLGEITDFHHEFAHHTLAEIRISQGRLDEALSLLALLLKRADEAGAFGYEIEILVLRAMSYHARKEADGALRSLERALTLAEPEGYVRTFIDQGEPMGELLRQAAARGIAVSYVGRLLAALDREAKDRYRLDSEEMVEPLSERELEVMRLLTTHLSSTDIAGELTISVNTVRTHIKNIYSKLDVHSREEAVQRVEELHIL